MHKNGYFLKLFKTAKVIPILKPGKDASHPESYHPISMLNLLDKVFEKIILKRLSEKKWYFTERTIWLQKKSFNVTPN